MKNIARTRLFYCLIFLFLVFAQSCKRELFEPSQTKAQATSKIQDIKYSEFFDAVNSSGMGDLKQLLAPANQGGNGQKLMSTNIAERQFRIDMNAVKKLVLGDTVSYVVSLMPSSAHNRTFPKPYGTKDKRQNDGIFGYLHPKQRVDCRLEKWKAPGLFRNGKLFED
jgi:hypothetical protein